MVEAAMLYVAWILVIIVVLNIAVGVSYLLLKDRIYANEAVANVEETKI